MSAPSRRVLRIWSRRSPAIAAATRDGLLNRLGEAGDFLVDDALLLALQLARFFLRDAQVAHELPPVGGLHGLAFPEEHQLFADLLRIEPLQRRVHLATRAGARTGAGTQGLRTTHLQNLQFRHTLLP